MANLIAHVMTPSRLYLAWQAPDERNDRYRYAVGEVLRTEQGASLRYLKDDEFAERNNDRPYKQVLALGYQGYPGLPPSVKVYTEGVLSALMRRVPPQSRSDFDAYRMQHCLAKEVPLSDFDLLSVTEAKLPSDGFSVVDPYDAAKQGDWRDLMFEIAGYRHYVKNHPPLAIGQKLSVVPEPDNKIDPGAVRLCVENICIGYVNRLQAPAFLRWLRECEVTAQVERLNGTAERLRAFAFVRVRPASAAFAA